MGHSGTSDPLSHSGVYELRPPPAKVIIIPIKSVRDDFRDVPRAVLPFAIRWLLGHEYWHQVQYADNRLGPKALFSDDDTARSLECEADLMGAYVVASDPMSYTSNSQVFDYLQGIPSYINPKAETGSIPNEINDNLRSPLVFRGLSTITRCLF